MNATVDEERLWVARAKRGDRAAFERLYRRYVGPVYGSCRRLVRTDQEAEEATQQAFVAAWQRLQDFRGDSSLGTWLRRIAINRLLDERKSAWRRRVEELGPEDEVRLEAPAGPPGARLDLARALERLPAGPRRVLVLHDVEGYTHAEVASRLGVTTGTTKTQLFRARRALREWLK